MMNMIAQGSQNNPYHNKINSKMVARCMLFTYRVLQSISKHKLKKLDNWQRAVFFYKNNIYIATIFAIFNQYFQRSYLWGFLIIFNNSVTSSWPDSPSSHSHFTTFLFLKKLSYQCDQGMLAALNILEDQKTISQKKCQ